MIFQPAIIALLLGSLVVTIMVLAASGFGVQVLRRWNIGSGSELQVKLERQTYLISTLMGFACTIELVSLLLFVFNADRMASQFVGAMCAVGTLNANEFGFPALTLKLINFFLAGIWLILNYVDNKGYDYPLIKPKYLLLLVLAPLMATEFGLQLAYFLGLEADIITSCCGSIFGSDANTVASEMGSLPLSTSMIIFYSVMTLTLLAGVFFILTGKGGIVFAAMSGIGFVAAIQGVISFISIYIYEHPHHHCPFDVIQGGYNYIGYPLYIPLFSAALLGLGVGGLLPFRQKQSLSEVIPLVGRRFAIVSVAGFALFLTVATLSIVFSNLIMFEK